MALKTNRYWYGLGRRKEASARVRLTKGEGKVTINGQSIDQPSALILQPIKLVGFDGQFNISAKVKGGGVTGYQEAIRLGVARALVTYDNGLKTTLRKAGFMTRDPREKERKKPGLKRARRAPQWQKR